MIDTDSLKDYRTKRDFHYTPEPIGGQNVSSGKPRFVIQKHAASTLHYDLRLEVEGVLKSWAIPKGPSTDPRQKRLAIPTEDHPLDYIDFEGVIPKGAYGAGTVLVWDTGTYENINEEDGETISMAEAIQNGNVKFWLNGKKIKQGFALIRTNKALNKRWLLIKMNDEGANINQDIVATEPQSVLSGRTLEEIADKKKI
ncbi:MAG: DNA polymerase ligase N-terminal domain-containing protein [Candidatus Bathyarchaeota archaeon]|nr:DNA polymerase ligase N-terminal domain-containing protein [Candidatus Bathyarchaeota archaeon]MDI9578440.1 DNA polymerase ligase N-terminal domain-containing protein [Thermoproteota archaeon]MDT8783125.1 DNA ligase [Candidatus Bathyarchaeota archaeon]NLD65859.1 DNA ligase [Thermoproteota archaeon]